MNLYYKIINNQEYLKIAKMIGEMKFITDGKWDWEHGLGHYKRVALYVKRILEQLNASKRDIELGMAAALLHDIGLSESDTNKKDHALKSSMLFQRFLDDTDVTKDEIEILKHAIKDHSNGNEINSNIGLALVLADKLDVTYHRTINSSIQDDMNKEIQKIKKVDIVINDKDLIVKYTVKGNLDLDILLGWEKAITIPKKIANYLNKEYIFMVNDKIININNTIIKC